MKRTLLLCTLLSCSTSTPADWLQWHKTEVQYLNGHGYVQPANPEDISKSIITLTHANGWQYGRNFLFMDTLFSTDGEPAQVNLYGEAYSTLSASKLLHTDLSWGLFKDIGITGGINLGENMDSKRSGFRAWLYGVSIDFALPGFDYFNVDFLRQRVTETEDLGSSWQITPVWRFPFEIAGSRWTLEGFADFIGKKGDASARQALAQPQLRLDVGDLFGHQGHLFVGVEYQYWHNKYGIKGLYEHLPQALVVWRF